MLNITNAHPPRVRSSSSPTSVGEGNSTTLENVTDKIIKQARSWIGTPYHHAADVKGAGVDCGMLLVRVFADCGLIAPFDPRPYPRDWHLHRSEERYLAEVLRHAVPVETPLPGDIIVWRYGRTFSHGGIVTEWPFVVHAYYPSGVVEESDVSLPGPLSDPKRERGFFRVLDKEQGIMVYCSIPGRA